MPLRRSADTHHDVSADPFVSALILAAGPSRRMGRPKLAIPVNGRPLLRHAVDAALASRCREAVVVLGAHQNIYRPLLEDLPVRIAENPEYEQGMATSIRSGIAALSADSEAVVILLADQPYVSGPIIDHLIRTYVDEGRRIVASAYRGVVGVPALFDAALYLELLTLEGDVGARSVIEAYPQHGVAVPIDDRVANDIDTPEDLSTLTA